MILKSYLHRVVSCVGHLSASMCILSTAHASCPAVGIQQLVLMQGASLSGTCLQLRQALPYSVFCGIILSSCLPRCPACSSSPRPPTPPRYVASPRQLRRQWRPVPLSVALPNLHALDLSI